MGIDTISKFFSLLPGREPVEFVGDPEQVPDRTRPNHAQNNKNEHALSTLNPEKFERDVEEFKKKYC